MADEDEIYGSYGGYDQDIGGYGYQDYGGQQGPVQYSSFGTPLVQPPMSPSPLAWTNESLYGSYGGAPATVNTKFSGKSPTADQMFLETGGAGTGGGGLSWVDEREKRLNAAWNDPRWAGHKMGTGGSTVVLSAPTTAAGSAAASPVRTVRSYMQAPDVPIPSYVSPVFERPVVDEQAVNRRIQESLNPSLSSLRAGIREAIARSRSSNPALQKYMMEGMMKGYGQGLGDITSKAQREGRQAYMEQDYKPAYDAAIKNYEARIAEARANWEAALKNWQNLWTNIQETTTT